MGRTSVKAEKCPLIIAQKRLSPGLLGVTHNDSDVGPLMGGTSEGVRPRTQEALAHFLTGSDAPSGNERCGVGFIADDEGVTHASDELDALGQRPWGIIVDDHHHGALQVVPLPPGIPGTA